jgi:hypothetical protein
MDNLVVVIASETLIFENQTVNLNKEQSKHLYSLDGLYGFYKPNKCCQCYRSQEQYISDESKKYISDESKKYILCVLGNEMFGNYTMLIHQIKNKFKVPEDYLRVISRLTFCTENCMNTYLKKHQETKLNQQLTRLNDSLHKYLETHQKSIWSLVGFPTDSDREFDREVKIYQDKITECQEKLN